MGTPVFLHNDEHFIYCYSKFMSEHRDNTENTGMGLVYSGHAPLEWTVSSRNLTGAQLVENEKCLRIILALSEYPAEPSEELAALERKVDITLEMVAELLRANLNLPEPVAFDIGAHDLAWDSSEPLPATGEKVDVALYLHDLYPRPLRLKGVVKSSQASRCTVALREQSEDIQLLQEKFIFLHHRRQIHQQRHT